MALVERLFENQLPPLKAWRPSFFRKSSLTRVPGVRYRAEKKLFNYETVAILPTGPINPTLQGSLLGSYRHAGYKRVSATARLFLVRPGELASSTSTKSSCSDSGNEKWNPIVLQVIY
jgi:hypothetical protein